MPHNSRRDRNKSFATTPHDTKPHNDHHNNNAIKTRKSVNGFTTKKEYQVGSATP